MMCVCVVCVCVCVCERVDDTNVRYMTRCVFSVCVVRVCCVCVVCVCVCVCVCACHIRMYSARPNDFCDKTERVLGGVYNDFARCVV